MAFTAENAKRATQLFGALRVAEDALKESGYGGEISVSTFYGNVCIYEDESIFPEAKEFFQRAAKWRVEDLRAKLRSIGAEVPV